MTRLVYTEVDRGIATITLDSPENRNALSDQLLAELAEAVARAKDDSEIRGVVLTAEGSVFCSGADLKRDRSKPDHSMEVLSGIITDLWTMPKTLITSLNGHARAGGTGLVAVADIAIAPDDATFAFTEVRLGLVPAVIGVVCARKMTPRAIDRWFLTGETFDADTAVEAGLLTKAVPRGEEHRITLDFVEEIRATEPRAIAITKQLLRDVPTWSLAEGLERASIISAERFASPEAAEGMASFREKRPPSWALDED